MSVDLTCGSCSLRGRVVAYCDHCWGTGRRRPMLHEWDALKAERDRYRAALRSIVADAVPCDDYGCADVRGIRQSARAALDSDPDLAERTRRIKADE